MKTRRGRTKEQENNANKRARLEARFPLEDPRLFAYLSTFNY